MAAYQGTFYVIPFAFKATDGSAIDITDWTFSADIREKRRDETELLSLTSENEGFVTTEAALGRFEMRITAEQTAALPTGRLVFDILRTDASPGPLYVGGGAFRVRQPVTR